MSDKEYQFNVDYAKIRNISDEDIETMRVIYNKLHAILYSPRDFAATPKEAVALIKGLEYTLQSFWKFDSNENFHNYWMQIKGCSCPKLDNLDNFGSGVQVLSANCPYHAISKSKLAKTWGDSRL